MGLILGRGEQLKIEQAQMPGDSQWPPPNCNGAISCDEGRFLPEAATDFPPSLARERAVSEVWFHSTAADIRLGG